MAALDRCHLAGEGEAAYAPDDTDPGANEVLDRPAGRSSRKCRCCTTFERRHEGHRERRVPCATPETRPAEAEGAAMSYRIVKEVRRALRDGQIKLTGKTALLDRLVLLLIADDCRDDTRQASVGMAELSGIIGVHRNTIGASVGRLEKAVGIVASRGGRDPDGQRKAATYQFPPDFRCTPQACASNSKLDAQLRELDAQLGPVGCTTQGCALPGTTPGTTPGEGSPYSGDPYHEVASDSAINSDDDYDGFIDLGGRKARVILPCDTPGCGQPSKRKNSIDDKEYCDDCYARLRTQR